MAFTTLLTQLTTQGVCATETAKVHLGWLVSLPGDVLLAAGGLRVEGAHRYRRGCVFGSTDGGETWDEVEVLGREPDLSGAAITHLVGVGRAHVFGLVDEVAEGADWWRHLARSANAGSTWEVVALDLPSAFDSGLPTVRRFEFLDPSHGLLEMESSTGEVALWTTDDGATSWRLVWKIQEAHPNRDARSYVDPRDRKKGAQAPWYRGDTQVMGFYELMPRKDRYVLRRFHYGRVRGEPRGWGRAGAIPRNIDLNP